MLLATHNGSFHADDVFATAILNKVFPGNTLIRTRDPELLKTADLVFDVGGKYDPSCKKFDHHFKNSPLRPNGVAYSSVGMIWKEYGEAYLAAIGVHSSEIAQRKELIDTRIILGLDQHDTGYMGSKTQEIGQARARVGHAVAAVSTANPTWIETKDAAAKGVSEEPSELFKQTVELAEQQFAKYALDLDPQHLRGRFDGHPFFTGRAKLQAKATALAQNQILQLAKKSGDVMTLPAMMPWDNVITPQNAPHLKYVVFPTEGSWRCQAVPVEKMSFKLKQPLPEEWRGKSVEELRKVTGVEDAIFCHPSGFIMGAKSKEGIQTLLSKAQAIAKPKPELDLGR